MTSAVRQLIEELGFEYPTFRLLRGHPLVRARQLDRHIRNPNVQRLAIGEAAMLG
jgi:hypothetical protein